MFCRIAGALALVFAVCGASFAQDVKAVLEQASATMGANNLKTIEFSGGG